MGDELMQLYGKKFIKRGVDRQIFGAKESRDAIVISVDQATRSCIIRIQGTDEDIYAPWPEGMFQQPPYLRVGQSVAVRHPKGNGTKMQILGEGVVIPTPVGNGSVLPTQPSTDDTVVSGGAVTVGTGLALSVASGSYRIEGTLYTLAADTVTLSTAPSSPNFRIDMLSVGADGTIDITAGTPHATAPVAPSLASNHAFIKYIMVPYGTTQLDQALHVGKTAAPELYGFALSMSDTEMVWADTTSTGTIDINDQYGKAFPGSYGITVDFTRGNGSLNSEAAGASLSFTWTSPSSTFTYTRGGYDSVNTGGDPDESPIFKAYLTGNTDFYAEVWIKLYDSLGDYMP